MYDMHVHTTASDGRLPLSELVKKAKDIHLRGFVVSDHDTTESSQLAFLLGDKETEIIPGVELTVTIEDELIDINGIFINPEDTNLQKICKSNRKSRRRRLRGAAEQLVKVHGSKLRKLHKGLRHKKALADVIYDQVINLAGGPDKGISSDHISRVLISWGLFKNRKQAFDECLGYNKNCYVKRKTVGFEEGARTIIRAGGIVSLNHPGFIPFDHPDKFPDDATVMNAFDPYFGKLVHIIETNYPYEKVRGEDDEYKKRLLVAKRAFYKGAASERGLIQIAGSDSHQKPDGTGIGEKGYLTPASTVKIIRDLARANWRKYQPRKKIPF